MKPSQRHAVLSFLPLAACLSAADAAAPAGAAPSGAAFIWELLAILLPLAFIIVCLLLLLRFLRRRFGLSGHDAPLSVVQVLPLGARERIVVVRSRAGRAFAIGVSANAVTLVSTLDSEDLGPAASTAEPKDGAGPMTLLQRGGVKRP